MESRHCGQDKRILYNFDLKRIPRFIIRTLQNSVREDNYSFLWNSGILIPYSSNELVWKNKFEVASSK